MKESYKFAAVYGIFLEGAKHRAGDHAGAFFMVAVYYRAQLPLEFVLDCEQDPDVRWG